MTGVSDETTDFDEGQKKIYGTLVAVGIAAVAVIVLLVQYINEDVLDNQVLVGGIMLLLAIALIGITCVPIIDQIGKNRLTRQKSRQAHESRMETKLVATEHDLFATIKDIELIRSDKVEQLFDRVGSVKIGDKEVELFAKKA